MSNPKLLLMDEPSIGISPIMVNEVASIIKQINALGVTNVLVEQNARMALRLAQTAYVLDVGKIDIKGPAKPKFTNRYTETCRIMLISGMKAERLRHGI